ncbi:MAG: transcription antitermination factor NusB [Candidatus Cyclobacteriaceae bacterium M2_1C_046]
MQTAFALRQCKEANFANALENIRQEFLPDLNSMEPQDAAGLAAQGLEAQEIFKKSYTQAKPSVTEGSNEKINRVVNSEIAEYHKLNDKDQRFLKNQMIITAETVYHYYLLNLLLFAEFADLAEKDKRQNHQHFIENPVIRKVKEHQELQDLAVRHNLSWSDNEDIVRQWFRDFIKTDEHYQGFNKKESVTFSESKELIQHLIKKVLFQKEVIESYWQEKDISWSEDRSVVLSLLKKTVKELDDPEDNLELQVLSYNWDDDKEFFKILWDNSLEAADKYTDLIAEKAKNWDVERLATTDRIILEMAIAEMIIFPSIPVKVTINEYIEVSKRYSTPKSKQFINGMLDVISKELIKEGHIKKSGRGLIDNK